MLRKAPACGAISMCGLFGGLIAERLESSRIIPPTHVTAPDGVISPRTLLATVDFADASHAALVLGARLARHSGADAHVLYVEDPLLDAGAGRAGIDLNTSSRLELRRLIRDKWPAPGWPPQLHVVAGVAKDLER